jgi:hypothetical protein
MFVFCFEFWSVVWIKSIMIIFWCCIFWFNFKYLRKWQLNSKQIIWTILILFILFFFISNVELWEWFKIYYAVNKTIWTVYTLPILSLFRLIVSTMGLISIICEMNILIISNTHMYIYNTMNEWILINVNLSEQDPLFVLPSSRLPLIFVCWGTLGKQ